MNPPKGCRILVVEDEAVLLEFICQTLRRIGHEVVGSVATGEEAVEAAFADSPDLILMDIRLRGSVDGVEATRRIREKSDVPVIFLTAHSDQETVGRAKEASPHGYLVKPFDVRELEVSIEVARLRYRMETELRRSNAKFRALLDASPDQILRLDRGGALLESSSRISSITDVLAPDVVVRVLACVDRSLKTRAPQRMEYGVGEERTGRWFELRVVPLGSEEVLVVIRDITSHKQALLRAAESVSMFQDYAQKLQSAREEERRQIAREIHDELGQTLVGLKMQLSSGLHRLGSDEGDLRERLESMLSALDRAIQEVRRITTKLRPLMLDDLGLEAAVEWLRQDFEHRTGIRCVFTHGPEIPLPADRATAAFRVVQEALTNVARHAQAARVTMSLKRDGDSLVLSIDDDGRGIDPSREAGSKGQGLLGMRERVGAWGGELSVEGGPGKGTSVTVRLPIGESGEGVRS